METANGRLVPRCDGTINSKNVLDETYLGETQMGNSIFTGAFTMGTSTAARSES